MATCSDDGLSWDRVECGTGAACLSTLPGAGCELQTSGTRSLEDNLAATARLALGEGYCTAFFVNERDVMTNNHSCPDRSSCVGAIVQVDFRGVEGLDVEEHVVLEVLLTSEAHDVAILRVETPEHPVPHVVFAPASSYEREPVYVVGHPRGQPLQSSLGILLERRERVEYPYRSGPKTKLDQLLYWAQAAPGSSGSPVFLATTHSLLALHHTGGLSPEDFGLTRDATESFTELLAATEADAIVPLLEAAGVPFERQPSEFDAP